MMKEMYNNYKKDLKNKNNILLVISVIFILGLIFGSIYITILKNGEKTTILNEVGNYFLSNNSSKVSSFNISISVLSAILKLGEILSS